MGGVCFFWISGRCKWWNLIHILVCVFIICFSVIIIIKTRRRVLCHKTRRLILCHKTRRRVLCHKTRRRVLCHKTRRLILCTRPGASIIPQDTEASIIHKTRRRVLCHKTRRRVSCHKTRGRVLCHKTRRRVLCHKTRRRVSCHKTRRLILCHKTRGRVLCHKTRRLILCHKTRGRVLYHKTRRLILCHKTRRRVLCHKTRRRVSCHKTRGRVLSHKTRRRVLCTQTRRRVSCHKTRRLILCHKTRGRVLCHKTRRLILCHKTRGEYYTKTRRLILCHKTRRRVLCQRHGGEYHATRHGGEYYPTRHGGEYYATRHGGEYYATRHGGSIMPQDTEAHIMPQDTEASIMPRDTEASIMQQDTEASIMPQDTEASIMPQDTGASIMPHTRGASIMPQDTEGVLCHKTRGRILCHKTRGRVLCHKTRGRVLCHKTRREYYATRHGGEYYATRHGGSIMPQDTEASIMPQDTEASIMPQDTEDVGDQIPGEVQCGADGHSGCSEPPESPQPDGGSSKDADPWTQLGAAQRAEQIIRKIKKELKMKEGAERLHAALTNEKRRASLQTFLELSKNRLEDLYGALQELNVCFVLRAAGDPPGGKALQDPQEKDNAPTVSLPEPQDQALPPPHREPSVSKTEDNPEREVPPASPPGSPSEDTSLQLLLEGISTGNIIEPGEDKPSPDIPPTASELFISRSDRDLKPKTHPQTPDAWLQESEEDITVASGSVPVLERHDLKEPPSASEHLMPRLDIGHDTVAPLLTSQAPSLEIPADPAQGVLATRVTSQPEEVDTAEDGCMQLKHPISLADFRFCAVLGKGGFGKVFLAEHKVLKMVAVKAVKKAPVIARKKGKSLMCEKHIFETISAARHPFLVNMYGSFQTTDRIFFILEYAAGGDLWITRNKSTKAFPEVRAVFYAACTVLGLEFLHERKVVHRDLKLANIVLDQKGFAKITDFGLSKEGLGHLDRTSTFCGTLAYLAPEMLMGKWYAHAVDWWSLGVIIYTMLLGEYPFPGVGREKILETIMKHDISYPPSLSAEAISIFEQIFEVEPAKRLGAGTNGTKDVKQHPFFRDIDWSDLLLQKMNPPYVPTLSGPDDVRHFADLYTEAPPILTPPTGPELIPTHQRVFREFDWVAGDTILT
uniref:Protein kinase C n=1 Tax=Leptobrachium leishanense TaxID=445787 RepID=A0A8C5PUG7_9ANUR